MEHFLASILGQQHGVLAYVMVFAILVMCGLGLPMPEDVTLILGGYLAYSKAVHFETMVAVCFVGILTGDSTIFFMGRRVGRNIRPGSWIGKLVTPDRLAKVEEYFGRFGQKIVMAGRFMPGLRAGIFFAAGASGLSYPRFILFDGLAACVSAPLFVFGGKFFGGEITHFILMAKRAQMTVLGVLFALIVGYVLLQRARRKRQEREALAASTADTLPPSKPPPPTPPSTSGTADTVVSRTTH